MNKAWTSINISIAKIDRIMPLQEIFANSFFPIYIYKSTLKISSLFQYAKIYPKLYLGMAMNQAQSKFHEARTSSKHKIKKHKTNLVDLDRLEEAKLMAAWREIVNYSCDQGDFVERLADKVVCSASTDSTLKFFLLCIFLV